MLLLRMMGHSRTAIMWMSLAALAPAGCFQGLSGRREIYPVVLTICISQQLNRIEKSSATTDK